MAAQRLLGDLDRDLVVARVGEVDLGDTRQRRDVVADALAEDLERALVDVAGERDLERVAPDG